MNDNRIVHLVEIPVRGKDGFVWNRLHGEREEICEALLKASGPFFTKQLEVLQTRLRKVDDALDRLMSGSYGNCSRCGRAIDDSKLDLDPALALCLDCWSLEPGAIGWRENENETSDLNDILLESLSPFDTILLHTRNTEYRILLIDPKIGRALVEGGEFLLEPSEALLRGSAVPGAEFKAGSICLGSRLEMLFNKRVVITSPIQSVQVKHSAAAESVELISAALQ